MSGRFYDWDRAHRQGLISSIFFNPSTFSLVFGAMGALLAYHGEWFPVILCGLAEAGVVWVTVSHRNRFQDVSEYLNEQWIETRTVLEQFGVPRDQLEDEYEEPKPEWTQAGLARLICKIGRTEGDERKISHGTLEGWMLSVGGGQLRSSDVWTLHGFVLPVLCKALRIRRKLKDSYGTDDLLRAFMRDGVLRIKELLDERGSLARMSQGEIEELFCDLEQRLDQIAPPRDPSQTYKARHENGD